MGVFETTDEIKRDVDRFYEIARESLSAVWPAVGDVARALLKLEELDRDGLEQALGDTDIHAPAFAVQAAHGLLPVTSPPVIPNVKVVDGRATPKRSKRSRRSKRTGRAATRESVNKVLQPSELPAASREMLDEFLAATKLRPEDVRVQAVFAVDGGPLPSSWALTLDTDDEVPVKGHVATWRTPEGERTGFIALIVQAALLPKPKFDEAKQERIASALARALVA